jgi:hypothetical protein
MMTPRAFALFAVLALAACVPGAPEPLPAGFAGDGGGGAVALPGPAEGGPDTCQAAARQSLLGQPASVLASAGLSQPVRVIPLGGIVSQEYDATRLNLYLDAAGLIVRITCG